MKPHLREGSTLAAQRLGVLVFAIEGRALPANAIKLAEAMMRAGLLAITGRRGVYRITSAGRALRVELEAAGVTALEWNAPVARAHNGGSMAVYLDNDYRTAKARERKARKGAA